MADNKDCIPDFNWRDYIKLEPDFPDEETRKYYEDKNILLSPEVEKQVVEVLDQLASIEDGQQLIMEAYKQNGNHKIGIYDISSDGLGSSFTPFGSRLKLGPNGVLRLDGINIGSEGVKNFSYIDLYGELHPVSLQQRLIHELTHAADPDFYPVVDKWNELIEEQERFFFLSSYSWMPDVVINYFKEGLTSKQSEYDKENLAVEEKTTQLTNAFMAEHYNATPQKEYHAIGIDSEMTPGILDVLELPTAQCTIPNVQPDSSDKPQNRLR